MLLAAATAPVAWIAAWFFRDQFTLSATLVAIGCLPVAVAIAVYLLLLVTKLESK